MFVRAYSTGIPTDAAPVGAHHSPDADVVAWPVGVEVFFGDVIGLPVDVGCGDVFESPLDTVVVNVCKTSVPVDVFCVAVESFGVVKVADAVGYIPVTGPAATSSRADKTY